MAETTFLRGLSVSSGDGRIQYLLAETFERQGKSALARAEYRDATHSEEPDVAAACGRQAPATFNRRRGGALASERRPDVQLGPHFVDDGAREFGRRCVGRRDRSWRRPPCTVSSTDS